MRIRWMGSICKDGWRGVLYCVESNVISEVTERCTWKTNEKRGKLERGVASRSLLTSASAPLLQALPSFAIYLFIFFSAVSSRNIFHVPSLNLDDFHNSFKQQLTMGELTRVATLVQAPSDPRPSPRSPLLRFRSECLRDLSNKCDAVCDRCCP